MESVLFERAFTREQILHERKFMRDGHEVVEYLVKWDEETVKLLWARVSFDKIFVANRPNPVVHKDFSLKYHERGESHWEESARRRVAEAYDEYHKGKESCLLSEKET